MAINGDLAHRSALKRFLARCPALNSNPRLIFLIQTGTLLTEDQVVDALAELFLHPSYTISILGCFRPLIRKIVDKAIDILRFVPDLTLSGDEFVAEIGKEDGFVIDFYVRSGRRLKLHELAVLAFGRSLELAPFVLRSVLTYFSFAPPPFQRLKQTNSASLLTKKGIPHLLGAVRASYRFITVDPKVFSELWDWSCFVDLVQCSANFDPDDAEALSENILDIRWCSIQVLSVTLKMSDRATLNLGLRGDEALACLLRWEEFCQDVSLEKAGWYCEQTEPESGTCSIDLIGRRDWAAKCDVKPLRSPFVLTSSLKRSFEMAVLAVSQKWPILLQGPVGSGKTALINELAQVTGNTDVLFIHMDDQLDSKTLIGSYVCTENPGEFRWRPGSLTQAVLKGFWVVFEDIDKAPAEVLSFLTPLLEGSTFYLTGRWEAITAAEGFRIFATISDSKRDFSHNAKGGGTMSTLWRKVMVGPPSNIDLLDIIGAWYPDLEPHAQKLVDTMERVNSFMSQCLGGSDRFSLRDLLKWCRRIIGLGLRFSGYALSASQCKSIYREAVDIFVASSASSQNRLLLMNEIARVWAVPAPEAGNLHFPCQPTVMRISSSKIGIDESTLQVGRVVLEGSQVKLDNLGHTFVNIGSSLCILESIACSVKYNEPVLLVGETGTGKTTLIQCLARMLGKPLTVLNLSQQTDAADLLGGFKPTDARLIFIPLLKEFYDLFQTISGRRDNSEFLHRVSIYAKEKNWKKLLNAFQKAVEAYLKLSGKFDRSGYGKKRKRSLSKEITGRWDSFAARLDMAHKETVGMSFTFVEGAFVTALRNGYWILLDEINLAPPETLQRVTGVLEGEKGTLCLAERGDVDYIERHPEFRIFACMNPATDAGKRDLPFSVRSRFTEHFVDDVLDDEDLIRFVTQYMGDVPGEKLKGIVCFYKAAKRESEERLLDGANQKPQFSLRSLARALEYTRKATEKFGYRKALYDGFCMFFLTLLDRSSAKIMNNMILSNLFEGSNPPDVPFDHYFTEMEIPKLSEEAKSFCDNYVRTKSVEEQLRNLSRAVFIGKYPVLLQGPTSSGKTSLVQYLAARNGRRFVRINNHEHTDLQEYFGSYVTDSTGKLSFQEGILVEGVRNGYWIVLDELNLAPSDVLEALNRLLDDNRELFLPELQETVNPHRNFMLFATQNPPTFYGGRKVLSRAFRNRFLEIHVDEIPEDEMSEILVKRCKMPQSYAKKMIEVMKDLQMHRQRSKVFAGKLGFITPRDLFRWADWFQKFGKSYEDLAQAGYFLLAERLRDESEKDVVQEILERRLRVKINKDELYAQKSAWLRVELDSLRSSGLLQNLGNIIWSESLGRLFFLVERCYRLHQPVLLVGETGGGKTMVCQLLSIYLRKQLHILNCHQYTEASDFLGGFYPVRERSRLAAEFRYQVQQVKQSKFFLQIKEDSAMSSDIEDAQLILAQLNHIISICSENSASHAGATNDLDILKQAKRALMKLQRKWQTVFVWQDGSLVQAMKNGDLFLIDEISLADDSILERLNSVLEPSRKLALAEKGGFDKGSPDKGGSVLEEITANPDFFLLATMNPGGDFGKRELSPALRNRFTEIWVPPVTDLNELRSIAMGRFSNLELSRFVDPLLKFWEWFHQLQSGKVLTVRDLLSWIAFVNVTEGSLGANSAFIHGAFLVLLDGLSLGTGMSNSVAGKLRERCLNFLLVQLEVSMDAEISKMENYGWGDAEEHTHITCTDIVIPDHDEFGINPFYIRKGANECRQEGFELSAPTTRRNALRVLRAMQLPKPVILEGSPGVGKTSLVAALGKFSGHAVVRINLSEQTDIMDLLGSDLPVEGENGVEFAWSDGILLQALKSGNWVILDELNLAPQSVLEGLNAILDHRAEVYIPELGRTFKCPPSFRVFACQNPSYQGGGRKGLPKSFLNRFTKVYVDELNEEDYLFICTSLYPTIKKPLLSKLARFNNRLFKDTMSTCKYGQDGSPWEFNLRDIMRSCEIIKSAPEKSRHDCFLNVIYVQRMRTMEDRIEVLKLYEEVFGVKPCMNDYPKVEIDPQYLIVGNTFVRRNHFQPCKISKNQLHLLMGMGQNLEAALSCVRNGWLCILVGPPSSGKTSLIRLLAELTGNALNEFYLSSGTDISELLGCFEQYNAFRNYRAAIRQVVNYINEYYSIFLESSPEAVMVERKELIERWLAFVAEKNSLSSFDSSFGESWLSGSVDSLGPLLEIVEQMTLDVETYQLTVSWSDKHLNNAVSTILELRRSCQTKSFLGKFEWVTGGLIRAIEHGEWVVLENANLCNPTVLDRINSLVEQGGSITVNECGLVDGKPVVLHTHPKFRLFLTVNPSFGEVSRAMRNRGVEVFLMQPHWLADGIGPVVNGKEHETQDVKRFLILSGVPDCKLVDAMAKAHISAKGVGSRFGITISLVELARWIHLFQELLMHGNQPAWSLQLSWEHIYLSLLGETNELDVVPCPKDFYLLESESSKVDPLPRCCLSLPAGWPTPLKLRSLVWYSKESSVKRNCMYLEFLGAHCASFELGININWSQVPVHKRDLLVANYEILQPRMIPVHILHSILLPTSSDQQRSNFTNHPMFDLALAKKMLSFAATWAIEQATEFDLSLYIRWFEWYGSLLQPYCGFFKHFLNIFTQERCHAIWNHVINSSREIIGSGKEFSDDPEIDEYLRHLPLLSLKLFELASAVEALELHREHLCRAIKSVGLLRRSFEQWSIEDKFSPTCFMKNSCCALEKFRFWIKPVLDALRQLEKEVLNVIVTALKFDLQLYINLLQCHTAFWTSVISSESKFLLISWHSLKKDVIKLQKFFPDAVNFVRVECQKLDTAPSWDFNPPKYLLWKHGGHPFLPPSATTYSHMQQLISSCDAIWSMPAKLRHQTDLENNLITETVASANSEFRFLVMEGVCMSSYIISEGSKDEPDIVHQLVEVYQMLLNRFDLEKHNLKGAFASAVQNPNACLKEKSVSACCSFFSEILLRKPAFESWLEAFPLPDSKSFSLDIYLLEELSKQLSKHLPLQGKELIMGLRTSNLLESVLNFSLKFSSRPPADFIPHQKILWVLDAWPSVESVGTKVASFVLEMWFRWHSSLWAYSLKMLVNHSDRYCDEIPVASILFQATKMETIDQILERAVPISDYAVRGLHLRVASRHLWQDPLLGMDLPGVLLSAARSLFEQIIFAHWKSFEEDTFAEIKSTFADIGSTSSYIHDSANMAKLQDLDSLERFIRSSKDSLERFIRSSSHGGLTSLIDSFIKPVLEELYCESHDSLHKLGCAWLHIGALRYHLLVNPNIPDPTMKYAYKHLQLSEKIDLLELEIKVRRECDHLAGNNSAGDDERRRLCLLKKLEMEQRRIYMKVVFRQEPSKFEDLKSEFVDFLNLVASSATIGRNLGCEQENYQVAISQARNWQETSSCFIRRLSEDYAAYIDIVQPVQIAIYEMKLGLSLLASSAMQKAYLSKIGEEDMNQIQITLSSVIQFPRVPRAGSVSVEIGTMQPEFSSSHVDTFRRNWDLLKKLSLVSRDINSDKEVSSVQSDASIYWISLLLVAHHVYSSHILDNASVKLLNEIFRLLGNLWMEMRAQMKDREDEKAQPYKFKPRAFKMEDIFKVDISDFKNFALDESSSSKWQDMLMEPESTEEVAPATKHEPLEHGWDLIEDSILKNMVDIHNQLFGLNNRAELVSDEDNLLSFIASYKFGNKIIQDLRNMFPSTLDANLVPEHLLHLCLKYGEIFGSPRQSARVYNFYKDSNAPVMVQMVQPLIILQERVISLFDELSEPRELQRISEVIRTLLAIPLDMPLAKALWGLQFLLGRVQLWNENSSKSTSLSDQLQPISNLASSWIGIELDCWPALIDGVQEQYEVNAGKLWFALYSILHREHSSNLDGYNQSTIESLKEFMQAASAGEFKKRLELLLAFHGQLKTSVCSESNMRYQLMETSKILYNVFGFYVQFLPSISEHIKAGRRSIETELKEHVKLSKWKFRGCYMSMDATKGTRQKFFKLIQKFNDVLQQPVMIILNQEATTFKFESPALLKAALFYEGQEIKAETRPNAVDPDQSTAGERSFRNDDWRKKIDSALQGLCPQKRLEYDLPSICHKDAKVSDDEAASSSVKLVTCIEVANTFQQSLSSGFAYQIYHEVWKEGWVSLEKIFISAVHCVDLCKVGAKNLKKRRALTDLLKLLESCGLSRHKTMITEIGLLQEELNLNQPIGWFFLQPSYDMHHLLVLDEGFSTGNTNKTTYSGCFQKLPAEKSDLNWVLANQYYFRNMAMMQRLWQARLNYHKSLSREQVERSTTFLFHLMIIQRDQRSAAYNLAEKQQKLRKLMSPMKDFDCGDSAECFVTSNQYATLGCMWQQKQLFDSLYATSKDASLFLKKVENTHVHICDNVKDEVKEFACFIDKFIPIFRQSKEYLDGYLLGSSEIVTTEVACKHPFVVSKQMERLVLQNDQILSNFEEHIRIACNEALEKKCVKDYMLNHFRDMIEKGKKKMAEFKSELVFENHSSSCGDDLSFSETSSKLIALFKEAFERTIEDIMVAYEKQNSLSKDCTLSEDMLKGSIASWKNLFELCTENLRLDSIRVSLDGTIFAARKLVSHAGQKRPELCAIVEMHLKLLCMLLNIMLIIGDVILSEFVAVHRAVAEMTFTLANFFTSLFSEGLDSAEDQKDTAPGDKFQDATGTGMGEGEGLNDVSDQIDDESQLPDLSEKQSERPDASKEVPSNTDKGIEMDQDFSGDTFSVSESSEEESGDDEEANIESAMGETGDKNGIVDEKHWDKDEDGKLDNPLERCESGPSVREKDISSRELRAKQDGDDDSIMDEPGGLNNDDCKEQPCEKEANPDGADGDEGSKDLQLEKEAAFTDPSGLDLNNPDLDLENMNVDEDGSASDIMEETEPEGTAEDLNDEGKTDNHMDEVLGEEEECKQVEGNSMRDGEPGAELYQDAVDMDCLEETSKEVTEQGKPNSVDDLMQGTDSGNPVTDPALNSNHASEQHQANSGGDLQTPAKGLSSGGVSEMEPTVLDLSRGGKATVDQPMVQSPEPNTLSQQRTQPNPYRSVGDALNDWKERAKISMDSDDPKTEALDDLEDEAAAEYRFVSDAEKSTSQALGSATSDQIDQNINRNQSNARKGSDEQREGLNEMEIEKEDSESIRKWNAATTLRPRNNQQGLITVTPNSEPVEEMEESLEVEDHLRNRSVGLVSVQNAYTSNDILQLGNLSVSDEELGKARKNIEEMSDDMVHDATVLWAKYEQITTRLSQELAEQLRLVMEPTVASKLQGNYRTGKRINMKKIIPYIASHFRKDKIWLRRTKPNKRDYQVVVAVDDSRSMSENRCGRVAIEALVTVCRAMSQLEVGQLAVSSFGEKGNIRLLKDFDQPFTSETGVKMISSLTFKQDNSIVDEPMVDLLKYLNSMLDAAVASARLPSGQNPLQQLVLIIADGRFHEKEKLKRCVRDVLSRKRLVAFVLLDNPQESIMDLMEASFEGQSLSFSKYLKSFPFPYYIILENVEALPRALADLLRQWFELMHNTYGE